MAYIALTARDNGQLQEKTDREGFTDNPYYRNFLELLSKFIDFTGNAQQFLRRGYNDYRRAQIKKAANVAPETTPEELSRGIGNFLAKAASHRTQVQQSALKLTQAIRDADAVLDPSAQDSHSVTTERLREHASALREQSKNAAEVMQEAESYLKAAVTRSGEGNVLASQITELREQIQQVYEIIGLGLTAEALSHEVNNVLMQLSDRTKVTGRMLRAGGSKDARLFSYLEYVESSVAALRRQMIFLEPTLRYAREKREVLDLSQIAKELQEHPYEFEQIVCISSLNEGVWEPDTLARIFAVYHRIAVRQSIHAHDRVFEVANNLRKLSRVRTGDWGEATPRAVELRRLEWFEDASDLNEQLTPLELGDIFMVESRPASQPSLAK